MTTTALHAEPSRHEAIMRSIQEAANKATCETVPIKPDMRIDWYFSSVGKNEWAGEEFQLILEDIIAPGLTDQDWLYLTGRSLVKSDEEWDATYGPLFTFGRLADLIAVRLPPADVPEISILGARSKSAGAFRLIQGIAGKIRPGIESFGPSTPVGERFRGRKLQRFWIELRKLSLNRVPPLDDSKYRIGDWMVGSKGVVAVLMGAALSAPLILARYGIGPGGGVIKYAFAVLICTFFCSGPLATIAFTVVRLLHAQTLKIPNGIETFRDLAELIAGDRGGWCEKCGYDLTGLTSERCPECGSLINKSPVSASPTGQPT